MFAILLNLINIPLLLSNEGLKKKQQHSAPGVIIATRDVQGGRLLQCSAIWKGGNSFISMPR